MTVWPGKTTDVIDALIYCYYWYIYAYYMYIYFNCAVNFGKRYPRLLFWVVTDIGTEINTYIGLEKLNLIFFQFAQG